ncbi:TPA: YitT family protein, partial [Listeria monocytogenes]
MANKRKKQPLSPVVSKLIEYIYVIIGAALIALAFNVLLLPNHVASGGV